MAAMDIHSLKAYVNGPSSQGQSADTVLMHISHSNLRQHFAEIRFNLHTSVESVKERLRTHTGTAVASMELQLFDQADRLVALLSDDQRPLGFYSPQDGYRIHVKDMDPASLSAGGWLEDTSLVRKFELSDAEYAKREGTFRKFKEQRLAEDPTWTLQKEMARRRGEAEPEELSEGHMADLASQMKVGDRCEARPGGRRGVVAYVGEVEGLAPGPWVGVRYDEPVGKHDGTVKGRRYFQCPPGYGSVLRPDRVTVGDFEEDDPFADDPDEI